MFGIIKKKTPEQKRIERIENKSRRLLAELELESHELTVDEQVEALVKFNQVFKQGKEKEVQKLVERQIEIAEAMKILTANL